LERSESEEKPAGDDVQKREQRVSRKPAIELTNIACIRWRQRLAKLIEDQSGLCKGQRPDDRRCKANRYQNGSANSATRRTVFVLTRRLPMFVPMKAA